MKSLRGKRGEDLIWNGSPQISRMGKASVALIFDNKDGKIPLEFEEVSVARKIFRDGLNEYYLNDSQVRLKDVVELMARIGLGETKHNIIGQGEVDRILMASPRERWEMLEEALGLRVYQLRKNEAERKLAATEQNMRQAEALLREIALHLKFLKAQAQKARTRGSVEEELRAIECAYLIKMHRELATRKAAVGKEAGPIREKQQAAKNEIERLMKEVVDAEKSFSAASAASDEEKEFIALETKRRGLERELGRLEGKLEVEREKASQPKLKNVDMHHVQEEIKNFLREARSLMEEEDQIETVRAHMLVLIEDMEELLREIERGTIIEKKDANEWVIVRELEKTIQSFEKEREKIAKEIDAREGVRMRERKVYQEIQQKIRAYDQALRAKQEEERDCAVFLERFRFEEEQIRFEEETLDQERVVAGLGKEHADGNASDGYEEISAVELKRKIERIRGKLEEIGGIDLSVVKEFEETETRHTLLSKEVEDLRRAGVSLRELIRELDHHIKEDFRSGFSKIKEEFHNYFRIIFGGGAAKLQIASYQKTTDSEEEIIGEEKKEAEEGIEISVDLPRKRIKGLAMLSGGERALTSIALLFAITAVNPPPFLVLDETDAALDEANSQRYAVILKELAKRTQLILVTHNRETMKCAGILYGVTMGDDGVSKLLSLKLEEAEGYTSR